MVNDSGFVLPVKRFSNLLFIVPNVVYEMYTDIRHLST